TLTTKRAHYSVQGVGVSSLPRRSLPGSLFFFNDPATTEIYPLSLHDGLPICVLEIRVNRAGEDTTLGRVRDLILAAEKTRSEEHTSELQSLTKLVCRLLL